MHLIIGISSNIEYTKQKAPYLIHKTASEVQLEIHVMLVIFGNPKAIYHPNNISVDIFMIKRAFST